MSYFFCIAFLRSKLRYAVFMLSLFFSACESAQAVQGLYLECSAFGGSHTIRMSFLFYPDICVLHWREIERDLEVILCEPPRLIAGKPYAAEQESLVHFNLETGIFMDQFGSMEEWGRCEISPLARQHHGH